MAEPGLAEAVRYFRQRPFSRILEALRQRYESLGRVGGRVRLVLSEEERLALRDFLGTHRGRLRRHGAVPSPGGAGPGAGPGDGSGAVLTLDLGRFDAALRASRFACTLPELLEGYFGSPIVTRPARRQARAMAWGRLLDAIQQEAASLDDPVAMRWAAALQEGQAAHSLSWLRRAFEGKGDTSARVGTPLPQVTRVVARALASLPGPRGRQESLPVFAASLTGDPHALDPDREAGRLLERALADLLPELALDLSGIDSPAMRREAILAAVGLARDDLSTTVLVANLRAATLTDGRSDPLVTGVREAGVPVAYPLRAVRRWVEVAASDPTFIVENPSVFGSLAESFSHPEGPTLVCTAGQPSLAAYGLLDRLARAGVRMLYGGDFDLPGILIARALKVRYGQRLHLWRMEPADYQRALARASNTVPLTTREKKQLASFVTQPPGFLGELGPLAEAMLRVGRKAFQENLLPELGADVAGDVSHGRCLSTARDLPRELDHQGVADLQARKHR